MTFGIAFFSKLCRNQGNYTSDDDEYPFVRNIFVNFVEIKVT